MSPQAATLSLRLFGAPEILADGAPVRLGSQKARALLYYLAATGRPHTREHLTTLLWSEAAPARARHSLRTCLYRLRQALQQAGAAQALAQSDDLLALDLGDRLSPRCDVAHFRALLAQGTPEALAKAAAYYRGPFLQGFTLADAPAFENWVREEETLLGRECVRALDRLARRAEAAGDLEQAAAYLERLLQLDPLLEDAQQRLLRLHAGMGALPRAVDQFRRFEAALKHELGLAPAEETRALVQEAVRAQTRAARDARPAPGGLPFVGREELLGLLLSLAEQARAGLGLTVLLEGQAGIGKTRLAAELAYHLAAATPPWIVLQGACSPFDDLLAFSPFLDLFGTAGEPEPRAQTADAGPPPADVRGRFFWRVLQTVRGLSDAGPVLLTIDDLQWADSATLSLFGFLALRLREAPILLVGTAQRADAVPALQRLVTIGRRRGGLQVLALEPLAPDAVSALLEGLGLAPESARMLTEWLHERAAGSPFILAEIIAQMRAEAILAQAGNRLRLDPARWLRWRAAFSLPETTHDLVAWRLANVSAEARRLLEALAVAGQPLAPGLIAEAAGVDAGAAPAVMDDLAARGLAHERADGTLALPHHLLRETLLHRLSLLRRRQIHRSLARGLEQGGLPGGALARQIAQHAVAGEDVERARRYGLQALEELSRTHRLPEALDFARQLNDLLAPSATLDERLRLTRVVGDLHQALGQLEAAARWRAQHLACAEAAGQAEEVARAYFALSELALVSYDFGAAVEAAELGLKADPAAGGRGRRLLGAALAMDGSDLAGAEAHLQRAAADLQAAGALEDLCAALFELGNVAAQRGELERALAYYEDAARAAQIGGVPYYLALAYNNRAYHSLLLGRLGEARQAVADGLKVSEAHDLLSPLMHLFSTQGELHLHLGEWAAASEAFGRGLALAEELGSLERQAGCRGGLALAARGAGDTDAALRLLRDALALLAGQGYWHLRTRLEIWLAETLLAAGRPGEAATTLVPALRTARAHGRALLLVQAKRLRAEMLAGRGRWRRAETLFGEAVELGLRSGTPLETARTRAAWASAALRRAPQDAAARALLAEARAALHSLGAAADHAGLTAVG